MTKRLFRAAAGGTCALVGSGASLRAAEVGATGAAHPLHAIDWAVVALYAAVVVSIGWWASRKPGSMLDYFLGARGFSFFTIGISMFVTLFSTVSYLSGPGEVMRYGPGIYLGMLIAAPAVYALMACWLVPALMKRRVLSLYELLGDKLGPQVRTLGACMFMLYRMVWMGVLLRFAATALSVILATGPGSVPVITVVVGVIAIIYTAWGGLRAVMLTDLLQFFVLFAGVVGTLAIVTLRFEGFAWFPTEWNPAWPEQPVFSWDLTIRVTLIGAALQWVTTDLAHGVDQTQVQRYMAAADLKQARKSVFIRVFGSVFVWTFLVLLGLALLSFYQQFATALPEGETVQSYADRLFPYFIAHELPIGLSGLVVAGILAAGMSSVDSGVNSITAVVLNDFIERRGTRQKTEAAHRRFASLLALGIGGFVIVFSLFVGSVPGNFYEVTNRTFRLFIPLELGLVVLAMFVRGATPFGVVWGIIYGFTLGVLISYWESFTGMKSISVTLYVPAILVIQLVTSWLFSRLRVEGGTSARMAWISVALAAPLVVLIGLILVAR